MKILRWILFLPLGFVASFVFGFLAVMLTNFFGGASWYVWLVSGAASSGAFIIVSLKVAPEENSISKWLTFATVSILGFIEIIGPFLFSTDLSKSFAGVAMVIMAISVIQPFNKKNETKKYKY